MQTHGEATVLSRATVIQAVAVICAALLAAGSSAAPLAQSPVPQYEFECSAPFPDAGKLPPMARQQLGLTMQSAASVRNLLSGEGRQAFWETYEEEGNEAALRQVREKAALYSIACGPDDAAYRSGVCTNFQLMCVEHGGGGCDVCARSWAIEQCKKLLGQVADVPLEAAKEAVGYDEEWEQIVSTARKLDDPDLLQHLDDARSRLLDDPIAANCSALF